MADRLLGLLLRITGDEIQLLCYFPQLRSGCTPHAVRRPDALICQYSYITHVPAGRNVSLPPFLSFFSLPPSSCFLE